MVLLLAVHTVEQVTAKVPLSMIILNDFIKRRSLPLGLKCRMVMPTSGEISVSLWEAADMQSLSLWLDENLVQDCASQVFEVSRSCLSTGVLCRSFTQSNCHMKQHP